MSSVSGGQRVAVAGMRDAADVAFEQHQAGQVQRLEHAHRLGGHFGSDPVAGKHRDLHGTNFSSRSPSRARAAIASPLRSASR